MRRRHFLHTIAAGGAASLLSTPTAIAAPAASLSREDWIRLLTRIVTPVLHAAAEARLQQAMPVEAAPGHQADRRNVTCLEAVGRTLAGIAPWLESNGADPEVQRLRELALRAIATGCDPHSPGYLRFGQERQTIVDAGFLSLAIARAPSALRGALAPQARAHLADALRATRAQTPPFNNWLLFAAMVECCLFLLGEPWDRMRVDYALREHAAWFLGDGVYGDGPHFHADYYNSYVIHPFLLAVLTAVGGEDNAWAAMRSAINARATRYAQMQERMVAPDGSFPVLGRSITYRCGAFHALADAALRGMLPPALPPAQVRCALSAVIARTLSAPGTFDSGGWLQIGLAGHQPALGETYISTGSLYLCTCAFLPLGLPSSHPFWSGPDTPYTAQRLWSGENLPADHAEDT